ncbi:unnamed protein product [Chrysoparadoxa australica]
MSYRNAVSQESASNYIEEFLDAISNVPNEIKRNLELIRTLDKSGKEMINELVACEKRYLTAAKRKLREKKADDTRTPLQIVQDKEAEEEMEKRRFSTKQIMSEKITIADQTHEALAQHVEMLAEDLLGFEERLKATGAFESIGAKPGDEVAIRLDVADDQWILARVLEYDQDSGDYRVMDEDDNSKSYDLEESNVIHLETNYKRLQKGDAALAVYPDTTSFYRCTITQPPRRGSAGGGGVAGVQFSDDADETGATPHRSIPAVHIIKLPL